MTISVSLFRPPPDPFEYIDVPELDGRDAAGFEVYRKVLWGSDALSKRGSTYFTQLRDSDLFVNPNEFPAFRSECDWVWRDARDIANEIWPHDRTEIWCPIKRDIRIRAQRVYGARSIRTYIVRFRRALAIAEERGFGFSIG